MNAVNKKSSSNWILCASKSFPGKSYYFNVQTGEAVWTLNDHEKNILKKENNIQQINSKLHNYPEPTTHPDTDVATKPWPNTPTSNHWQDYQQFAQYTPMLNQYMPMANTVMMPIQWPAPIWPYLTQDARKPTTDKITQTSQIERNLFVQTSSVPLSKRFVNYETPLLAFDKENKIINRFAMSNKHSNSKMELSGKRSPVAKSIPETVLDLETKASAKSVDSFQKLANPVSCNLEYDTTVGKSLNCVKNMAIEEPDKIEESRRKHMANLDSYDLRFLLEAKKRKLFEKIPESLEIKKTKVLGPVQPKKTVSFDLEPGSVNDSCDENGLNVPKHGSSPETLYIPISPRQTDRNFNNTPASDFPSDIIATESMDTDNTPTDNQTNSKNYIDNNTNYNTKMNPTIHQKDIENNIEIYNTKMNPTIHKEDIDNNIQNYNTKMNPTIDEEDIENYVATSNDSMEQDKKYCNNLSSNALLSEDIHRLLNRNKIVERSINKGAPLREFSSSYTMKDVWYIVTDMDVLLEEHDVIDQLLRTYESCRLLIPQCLHVELESICIGDCRGQQRVLVARQISRRISATNAQYTVEPPPYVETDTKNTMERILNCCIRAIRNNYYLVLITNNPHLLSRARSYNIRSHTTQEIKNGAIINPKSFSELKRLVVTLNNVDVNENNEFIKNKLSNLFSKREKYLNPDKKMSVNDKNCDILINITKPKSRIINDDSEKYNSNVTTDINNRMQILNIKSQNEDPNIISQNVYSQNHNANRFIFGDTNIKNPVVVTSNYYQNHTKVTTKLEPIDIKQNDSQNETFKLPSQIQYPNRFLFENNLPKIKTDANNSQNFNIESSPYIQTNSKAMRNLESITNNIKQNYSSEIENINTDNDKNNKSLQENNANIITTAARRRIETIIKNININTNKTQNNYEAEYKESTSDEQFKNPKILSLKRGAICTSTPKQKSIATDQIRSNFKKPSMSVDDSLKNFCMKNTILLDNFKIRMDEWICIYTQIMEDLLRDVLQINFEHTNKVILSPISLQESLTCVKMLYDNTRLREIVENIVDMLNKHSCGKGKIKLDIRPLEFLKIIGLGVLLVETLKTILPSCPILLDYEHHLDGLLNNMEHQRIELDPELLRPTSLCRSEVEDHNMNARLNYRKEPGYVINYLRRHYKEWMDYVENINSAENVMKNTSNQEDCKIVRMFGKNANMLKIDNNKSISYINTTINTENNLTQKGETKIIRLVEIEPENVKIKDKETVLKARKSLFKSISKEEENKVENYNTNNIIDDHATKENNSKTNANTKDQNNFENTQLNSDKAVRTIVERKETAGPKMINTNKTIENIKNKELLDLDALDFSEIRTVTADGSYENSVNNDDDIKYQDQENPNKDKSKNLKDSNQNPEYFDQNTKIQANTEGYAAENYIYASRNEDQKDQEDYTVTNNYASNNKFDASKENPLESMHEDIVSESNYEDSVNIQVIFGSRGNNNINYKTEDRLNENYTISDRNYAKEDEYYAIENIDYMLNSNVYAEKKDGYVIDTNYAFDCERFDENYALNQMTPRHDSTNDSGFESTSTQAYNVVKIFINELGITFKVVYDFIANVIEEISGEAMCEERKNVLHVNANKCLQEMIAIIQELKCIIKRETQDNTPLKILLMNAGVKAMADTRATKYRQTISKYLEQAEILENALRTIVSITVGENIPNNTEVICSNMKSISLFD